MKSTPQTPRANTADHRLPRRDFLRLGSLAAGGLALAEAPLMPSMAGPFEANEYLKTIPVDKKLDPVWVRSLFSRGEKQTYSDPTALDHIGMPVGGFFAGTVYLAGDGRLWLWDIFNRDQTGILPRQAKVPGGISGSFVTGGLNYLYPAPLTQPFGQAFKLRVGEEERRLDRTGFEKVTFDGRYPIGRVTYRDEGFPVEAQLEAFSPFIPLNLDDSSLPATVMSFTLTHRGDEAVEVVLSGEMENVVCLDSRRQLPGRSRNRIVRDDDLTALVYSAEPETSEVAPQRPDVVFEDFEQSDYTGWTAEGSAFGNGPIERSRIPDYQGDVGGEGKRVVNSHATAPGDNVGSKDAQTGKLTSDEFKIERRFINLWIGGGAHQGATCVNVRVEGKIVASVTGGNNNRMTRRSIQVGWFEGRTARLEIVDAGSSGWGNIGVDQIVFSDQPATAGELADQHDFGTMTLALLGGADSAVAAREAKPSADDVTHDFPKTSTGVLARKVRLAPGESVTVNFAITWHFPNFRSRGCGQALVGHYYATRFESALAVARYLNANFARLAGTTRRWVETWYDSTLPFWFLDRTMANTSTLATTTCYRFKDGRFWAWEGIGCCAGTCTHVWHYAQAPGRLFPELERLQRERVDFGIGFHEDGGIGHRANLTGSSHAADDGQCGRVLGVLREHQMSPDDRFLRRLWPNVKRALEYMYFNECMTGFEWQAAAHMIWEGRSEADLLRNGLAISRAIHDRYDARLRNPYNEVECSDHYARAMASYGAYQAACGFRCHGPQGHLEFAPRLTPRRFRSAFVAASGWGTFEQRAANGEQQVTLHLQHGTLKLRTLVLGLNQVGRAVRVKATLDQQTIPAQITTEAGRGVITFTDPLRLQAEQDLRVVVA